MPSATTLDRAARDQALQCTHCGSLDVYLDPGRLAALANFVHRARYCCRNCAARFWQRAEPTPLSSAVSVETDSAASGLLDWPEPQNVDVAAGEPVRGPATRVADLSALDAELARLRAAAIRRRMPFGDS